MTWQDDNPHHIGRFVQQLKMEQIITVPQRDDDEAVANMAALLRAGVVPVVDITMIREQSKTTETRIYEDLTDIHPVWPMALMMMRNQHGNIYGVMSVFAEADRMTPWDSVDIEEGGPVNTGDWWSRVHNVLTLGVFNGGRVNGEPVAATGPVAWFRVALDEHGGIIDLNAMYPNNVRAGGDDAVVDAGETAWHTLMLHLGTCAIKAFMFAGCANVELVDPAYPRRIQKRLDRTGTRLQTIVIKKTGKTYQHRAGESLGGDVPQAFVRGHFAKYGMDGRGKLFGKYTGKFWIPGHVRGITDNEQEREVDYKVEV